MAPPSLHLDAVRMGPGAAPLTLHLQAGETLALVGPNGVGKSTLLRILAGLDPPAAGVVRRPARVSWCPQDYRASLLPWAKARFNIALPTRTWNDPERSDTAVSEAARIVGLTEDLLDQRPPRLSGGVQQRVALARALAAHADLLLLDEPLSAVDPAARHTLRRRLREALAARGGLCVLVTHDLDDVRALATRGLVLIAYGAPARYDGPVDARLLAAMQGTAS